MLGTENAERVFLSSRPVGKPTGQNFGIEPVRIEEPAAGEVVVRTIYLSLDPYMRGRMSANPLYETPLSIGDTVLGSTVCEVISSRTPGFEVGDYVLANTGWRSHATVRTNTLILLDPERAPISTALGVLGVPGFTGYTGLLAIGQPKKGETVVVAAASGPVGSVVGRASRAAGARTVGIAGGAAKVAHLRELGFDCALDHRSPSFASELARAVPAGIDVYFENVGGKVWDAVMPHLNTLARVPVSGLVAHYDEDESPVGLDRMGQFMRSLQMGRWTVRGFVQSDFTSTLWDHFQSDVARWIANGDFPYREDIVVGLRSAPAAFAGLLQGRNFGKMLVQVSGDRSRAQQPGVLDVGAPDVTVDF